MSVSTQKIEKAKYGKRYYAANREKVLARTRQWRVDNPERHAQKSRNHHNSIRGRAKSLFNSALRRAEKRNYEIDIDLDWVIFRLEKGHCEITGIPFVFETRLNGHRNPYSPSLDRKDSTKGYTKENCRIILWALNMGFADWGQEIYLHIAKRLVEYDL